MKECIIKLWSKLFSCKKSRTTVLLGAGAVLEIGGPTTSQITKEIVDADFVEVISKKKITLIKEINEILKSQYPGNTNFETIFHILEMLNAYRGGWTNSKNSKMYPPFSAFVKPIELSTYEYSFISQSIQKIVLIIAEKISSYNDKTNLKLNKWYENIWHRNSGKWDFFTLNYDTTIEQIVQRYEDGFEDIEGYGFKRFNPKKLLNHSNKITTISHLHGCVEFGYSRYSHSDFNLDSYDYTFEDLYKWPSYNDAKETWFGKSNSSTQAGEQIYQGSIITGLHKLEKLNCYPYSLYHSFFASKIANNKQLLVVGYSFGDLYVNQLIERMNIIHGSKKRILLITYFDLGADDGRSFKEKIYHYTILKQPYEEFSFIAKMMNEDYWYTHYTNDDYKLHNPIISKDGSIMLFIHGFKDAVERHSSVIFDYLKI